MSNKKPGNLESSPRHITAEAPQEKEGFYDKIADLVDVSWKKIKQAPKSTKNYFTEPPQNDNRSTSEKFRDAGIAVITSPTLSFNGANIAFNISQSNTPGAVLSGIRPSFPAA